MLEVLDEAAKNVVFPPISGRGKQKQKYNLKFMCTSRFTNLSIYKQQFLEMNK